MERNAGRTAAVTAILARQPKQEKHMRTERGSAFQAGRPPPAWRAWVERHWAKVRVAHAESRRCACSTGAWLRMRAVVHLGELAPVDVHVDLVRRGDESGDSTARRLWSIQSYRNGAFVYEGRVPEDESRTRDVPRDYLVRVRPALRGGDDRIAVAPAIAPVRPSEADVREPGTHRLSFGTHE
jgi:hypothetical protein